MPPNLSLGKGLRFADLFCGIGGFHLALASRLGMTCELACEIASHPRNVYSKHFGIAPDRFPNDITEHVNNFRNDLDFDVVCGGFPCQGYSQDGKQEGFADSKGRGAPLVDALHAFIKYYRPAAFLLENVDKFGSKQTIKWNGQIYNSWFDVFAPAFVEIDYVVTSRFYYSFDFGLPQIRNRTFIVGFDKTRLDGLPFFRFPDPIPNEHPARIFFDEIVNGIPYRKASANKGDFFQHEETEAWTMRKSGEGGRGAGLSASEKYLKEKNNEIYRIESDDWSAVKSDKIERIDENGVKVEYRELYTSERLRLLGFPDGFLDGRFGGAVLAPSPRYQMTGNSVSVPTLYAIAVPMIDQIRAMKPKVAK